MNDAIMTGGVDMGLNTVGRWATIIPAMEVFDVPFVFPGYEKVDSAIDGGMGKILEEEMAKKHVKVVYWADYGFVQYANNKKPIKKPEDFKGLKIRGYSELASETIKALGASPVTMGAGEVYMALQRGTIDGQSSGAPAMRDRKMYEVTKFLTVTNHASPEFVVAMNDKSFAERQILCQNERNTAESFHGSCQRSPGYPAQECQGGRPEGPGRPESKRHGNLCSA